MDLFELDKKIEAASITISGLVIWKACPMEMVQFTYFYVTFYFWCLALLLHLLDFCISFVLSRSSLLEKAN